MSIIDRAAQGRCRDWAKLIGTARKLESEETREREALHAQLHDAERETRELQQRVFHLQREVQKYRLAERMRAIELPEADQRRLLDAPAAS